MACSLQIRLFVRLLARVAVGSCLDFLGALAPGAFA